MTSAPTGARVLVVDDDPAVANMLARLIAKNGYDVEIAEACRRWSATPIDGDAMNRLQAQQVWALRLAIPERERIRFDALAIGVQAQLAEIYAEVWSAGPGDARRERRA